MFDFNASELGLKLLQMLLEYAPRFLMGMAIFYFGFKLVNKSMKVMDTVMRKNNFDKDLRPFIITLSGLLLKMIISISAVDLFGIETTSFVAMLAAAGFAVGLALQGSLSNFASGILILFFKPFRTGDMIHIGDNTGIVKEIQIFNTILITIHHRQIIIPNSTLTTEIVENITGAGTIRLDLTFGISYDDDIDKARAVIESVIKECPLLVHNKKLEHRVLVEKLNDSSVDFAVWVWTSGEDYWETFYYMQEHVKKAFDKADVTIPYPQMDVHVQKLAKSEA